MMNSCTSIQYFLFRVNLSLLSSVLISFKSKAAMGSCAFDKLFEKSVPHVLEKIFLSLDYESYKTCLEVSHIWKELLISESYRKVGKSLFHNDISNDQEKLWIAATKGHLTEVRRLLLSRMLDVNYKRATYLSTPLHNAALGDHKAVVNLLLDRGADPNRAGPFRRTPLHEAAFHGHIDIVKILLDGGGDPNRVTSYGLTCLHGAIDWNFKEVVQILLQRGAEVDKQGAYGCTPLHWAAMYGSKEVVQTLLDKGATPCITNNNGETAIDLARLEGHKDIVNILMNKMAVSKLTEILSRSFFAKVP